MSYQRYTRYKLPPFAEGEAAKIRRAKIKRAWRHAKRTKQAVSVLQDYYLNPVYVKPDGTFCVFCISGMARMGLFGYNPEAYRNTFLISAD